MATTGPPEADVWIRLSILATRLTQPVRPLLERFGSGAAALEAPIDGVVEALGGLSPYGRRVAEAVRAHAPRAEIDSLRQSGAEIIPWGHPLYPRGLLDLADAPPCLFVRGNAELLQRRCVSVVGSRKAGLYGLEVARNLGRGLASAGVCVVSGLAVGVDAAAHAGALESGGLTAAILGCGIDQDYPKANVRLRERIIESGGVVLSELPPGTPPSRETFPHRNRLVAALSLLTIVVGASETSGALITADRAADLGRDVAAVPGSIRDPFNRGAHQLIRDGAHVVDGPESVLELLGVTGSSPSQPLDLDALTEVERRVFAVLAHGPTHTDALCDETGLTASEVLTALTGLATRGLAEPRTGGCYVRAV